MVSFFPLTFDFFNKILNLGTTVDPTRIFTVFIRIVVYFRSPYKFFIKLPNKHTIKKIFASTHPIFTSTMVDIADLTYE